MRQLIERAEQSHTLSKEEIVLLLTDPETAPLLFRAADRVRQKYVGDEVYLRALIEFSSFCKNNCCYCGLRKDNLHARRYRLTPEQILSTARLAAQTGYKTVVLQSGEDLWFTPPLMADIIKEIKKLGLAITLSIGEKTRQEYALYRQAGADRYLLRIETTDQALYEKWDPDMSWQNRARCLQDLKDLGYEVGSGSLVGLPGQTPESLADDLLFFKALPVDMAGIGPFIPHPQTPLAQAQVKGHFELSLKMMALMRLLLPDINIPATTAMESLHPQGRLLALQSGANVIMPNISDMYCQERYDLYPGKVHTGSDAAQYIKELKEKLSSIGRTVLFSPGFHGDYLKGKASL